LNDKFFEWIADAFNLIQNLSVSIKWWVLNVKCLL